MASLKDDNINFAKLKDDADKAMAADNLYWLQNDAKFRAVKQKGTYEEFKEIVAAAHLKPLDKTDKIQLDEKVVSPWNPTVAKRAVDTKQSDKPSQSESAPVTSNQFIRKWRTLKQGRDKLTYLNAMEPEALSSLFKNEIPFGLLGEFLIILDEDDNVVNETRQYEYLQALSETGRFNLSLTFLTSSERDALQHLINRLKTCGNKFNLDNIEYKYGLK